MNALVNCLAVLCYRLYFVALAKKIEYHVKNEGSTFTLRYINLHGVYLTCVNACFDLGANCKAKSAQNVCVNSSKASQETCNYTV